ncbi:hypothetical protein Salat_2285800 [Sesamum alatum]|uniref:Uncharacterized protein n=1 Tax=Sesamum alatum TaxID=300844 RepID=A0AAE2CE49_9LAMI|nr:hypothetical protein Salat_2285800 [Sesamum alatum]
MNNGGISLVMKAPPLFSSRPTTPALKPASEHILMPFRLPQPEARHARTVLIASNEGSVHLPSSAGCPLYNVNSSLRPNDVSPTHSARVLAAPLHIPSSARVSIDDASPPSSDLTPRVCTSVAPPSCVLRLTDPRRLTATIAETTPIPIVASPKCTRLVWHS